MPLQKLNMKYSSLSGNKLTPLVIMEADVIYTNFRVAPHYS